MIQNTATGMSPFDVAPAPRAVARVEVAIRSFGAGRNGRTHTAG